jgi:CP family cyanate transporter-like MFS transporter
MPSAVRAAFPWLTVAAVMVASLSLRGPVVSPTPVLGDIERDLGLTPAVAGLLTTAPVLMFALFTPSAALVIRRIGAEIAVAVTLVGVLVGTVLRIIPGFGWLLAGMVVIGASITLGNIVMPVIIRRDVPPRHVTTVTASYAAFLNAGSLITVLATAPLADLIGWPAALLAWSAITVVGLVLWSAHMRRDRVDGLSWAERDSGRSRAGGAEGDDESLALTGPLPVVQAPRAHDVPVWRLPIAWLLMLGFSSQTGTYYGLTTWLPSITGDLLGLDRAAAGALASVFQGVAIFGALLVPVISRIGPPSLPAVFVSACWLITGVGLFLDPERIAVWIVVGALAHSGGFVVIFALLVRVARSDRQAAGMSAFVQGGGYIVAAIAAPALGAVEAATGGWTVPLACVLVSTIAYGVFVLWAHASARRTVH